VNKQIGVEEFKYGVIDDPLLTGGEGVTWPTFRILGHPPHLQSRRSKTGNITNDITSQHSNILAMCCKVISSFLIFVVLDLRDCGCHP